MSEPIWIELEETLLIHARMLERYGGGDGIRDIGLLHSALAKPKQIFYYAESSTIFDLAAAYIAGIVKKHPFIDGNKRVGLAVGDLFLGLNSIELNATNENAATTILQLAAGEITVEQLAEWLTHHT